MFKRLLLMMFVVSGLNLLAEDLKGCYVFSTHPCSIVLEESASVTTKMTFSNYSSATSGYISNEWSEDGMNYFSYLSDWSFTASADTERQRFKGWFTKRAGWYSSELGTSVQPTASDAVDRLTKSRTIDGTTIATSGHYGSGNVIIAKYVSLWDVAAQVEPAEAGSVSGTNRFEEGQSTELTASANPGWSFARWELGSEVVGTSEKLSVGGISTNVTYTAVFTGNVYMVTFDANGGGSSVPSSKRVTFGAKYGDLASCSWESHTFDGWFTAKEGGTQITADTDVTITADQTLYAHWTTGTFTVTYQDASQFDSKVLKTEQVAWGGTATPPSNPQHNGWTFSEWTGWNGFDDVKQTRTYVASGRNNTYLIRYNANDGETSPVEESFTCYESQNLRANSFARQGYEFAGWDTDQAGATVVYLDGATVLNLAWGGTVNLYAVWRPISYSVHFDPNGGEGEMQDQSLHYGDAYEVPSCGFMKDGGKFSSWELVNSTSELVTCRPGDVVSNLTDVAESVVTLKARWQEFYEVAFEANGGSGSMTNVLFERDVACTLPSNRFERTGYGFLHWTTNGIPAFADGAQVMNLAEMGKTNVLVAAWGGNTYFVRFNANPPPGAKATGTMPDQAFVYGESQALVSNRFESTEIWAFDGWSNTVSGAVYADGETVSNLCAQADGVLILDARWKPDVGELSEAMMDNPNLKWVDGDETGAGKGWKVVSDEGNPLPCVGRTRSSSDLKMYTRVLSPGRLTFRWRPLVEGTEIRLQAFVGSVLKASKSFNVQEIDSWNNEAVFEVPDTLDFNAGVTIRLLDQAWGGESETFIDNMTWTPAGGGEPTPGEAVAPTAAGVADGVFSLTIPTASGTDYGVWTNADLTVDSWGLLGEPQKGEGNPMEFNWTIVPEFPQLFFRAHKVEYR